VGIASVELGIYNNIFRYQHLYHYKENRNRASAVAHVCNPSYSGGGDQEDHSSWPAWAKVSEILFEQTSLVWSCTSLISAM
jgi:hypothetical protein